LFESSPVGIALSNPDGWLLSVNKAVLDMVRIKEDELLEHNVVDFYDDPGDRDALLRELNESGMVQDFGVRLVRRDGSRFYASMNVSKLVIEGNEVLLAMVQDVTAQINAEQESAALGERARLARELHDAVSQTIFSASLLADTAVRASKAGRAVLTQDLENLRRLLRGALDELRTMLLELRPVALQDRTLGQMLGTLAETARGRSSAAVDLEIKGDRVLPERVTTTLYRIAQESLNNAVRHAAAQRIRIDLACDPDEVVLVICDDGLGFDIGSSSAGHHGLDIMRERAEEIGAVLEIESRAGSGTRVTANWS
jgi:two-component system nitrate/nitrite sensor histidine kinase NarX